MKKSILTILIVVLTVSAINSQTWVRTLSGYSIWSVCRDIQGNVYAGTTGSPNGLFKTTDGGSNWTNILSGSSNYLGIAVDSVGNIYAANSSNGLMKSSDSGLNWVNIPVSVFNNKSLQTVACGKNGYIYVGTVTGGIYRSTDYGNTFPDTSLSTASIVSIYIDKFNPDKIFAGASSASGITGVFISTNAGFSFNGPYNLYNCWGFVQNSPNELYMITTSTGYPFLKTTDGGYNWFSINTLTGAMRGMTKDAIGNFYVCGNGGVFKSTNNGLNFTNFGLSYSGNLIVSSGNKIYAAISGTSNGGVWIYTDSTISNVNNNNPYSLSYVLYQNYPNPFNPKTQITFELKKPGNISLIITDLTGKEIDVLYNGYLKSGKHNLLWNAENISSGVYFYTLKSEKEVLTRKMILLK